MSTRRKSQFLKVVIVILISLVVQGACYSVLWAKDNAIVWRMNCSYAPQGYIADAFNYFADEVERRSNGDLVVEVYYNSSLGFPNTACLTSLKKNKVELSEIQGGSMDSEEPMGAVINLPLLHNNMEEAIDWQINQYAPVLNQTIASKWKSNIISCVSLPAPIEFFSKKPIRTLDDLKGEKIRCWGGIPGEALAALGANPFTITTAELYTALQRGMVSAAITSYISASECHFWEVLNYIDHIVLSNNMVFIAVNNQAFSKLSDNLKTAVINSGEATTSWAKENRLIYTEKLKNILLDGGMKEIWPESGEVEKMRLKCKPIYKKFITKICPEAEPLLRQLGALK